MGSYANLWLSNAESPLATDNANVEILYKWDVSLGWLALCEPEDFSLETVEEDEEVFQVLYSSKSIDKAVQCLEKRSPLCAEAGGESWTQGMRYFVAFLTQNDASFVHVGYNGLMDDDFPALDQRALYIERSPTSRRR